MNTAATELTQQQQADVDAHVGRVNQSVDESVGREAILALCARIQAAAIRCDDYHVFVSYSPHVSGLAVYVERTDTEYHNPERVLDRLIDEMVYIDRADSLEKLTALVDQLQRLGIDV